MKLGKKILIACLGVLLFAVVEYVIFYVVHYVTFNDYEDALTTYTVEEGKTYSPKQAKAEGDYDLISENSDVKFYANVSTGEIAVYDIAEDKWYYSTPENLDADQKANETNKSRLRSQLILKYFNASRNEGTYNSYTDCLSVDPAQLSVESIDGGIRFMYHFKQKASAKEMVPFEMDMDRYEDFTSKMEAGTFSKIKGYFEPSSDGDKMKLIESLYAGTGAARAYDAIYKAFYNEAGYTDADYLIDMADMGIENAHASFKVPLEYRLTDDGLQVNIPTSLIEEAAGSIYTIEVLPGFGYASKSDEGYFVVPNGSGSLINFNNARSNQYSAYVYGIDPIAADYTKVENAETVRLPMYGICFDNSTIVASIQDGSALAQISSQTAGASTSLSEFNTIDFTFCLRGRETLAMFGTEGNASNIPIVEKNFADCNIQYTYSFLGSDYKGYSGVANFYREKLVRDGKLEALGDNKSTSANDIGFYYDVIGAVKVTDFFLGVKYLGVEPMTTYAQAKDIAAELNDKGIKNQVVNFQGWFNGGYYHDVADKVKNVGKLGSLGKFEDLASYVEGLGGRVYADVAFQKVTDISKRYNISYEAAKYYSGFSLELGAVNPTTLRQTAGLGYREVLYSVVSPKFLVRYVDKFISKTDNLDVTGISLRDLGDVISSDKKRTEIIDREASLDVITSLLKKFDDNGDKKVMVSGGNDYAVQFADDLINVPIGENNYYSVDVEIPLYEMIYHGYVDYACYDINTSDTYNVDDISLRLIEYGCSPHFVFTHDESNEMKYTGVNNVYSSTFDTWKDTSVEIYNKVNDALKYVKNAEIVQHETLESGVKKVTYSNGAIIYVNTTADSVTEDGVTVEAKTAVVKGVN